MHYSIKMSLSSRCSEEPEALLPVLLGSGRGSHWLWGVLLVRCRGLGCGCLWRAFWRVTHLPRAYNLPFLQAKVMLYTVDDACAVPAGPTVLNVLSGSVGMSSVEKHRDDISGEQNKRGMLLCLCVCEIGRAHV